MDLIKCECCGYKILPEFIKIKDNESRCPDCIDILTEELYDESGFKW